MQLKLNQEMKFENMPFPFLSAPDWRLTGLKVGV
jgi:hypothetical protein